MSLANQKLSLALVSNSPSAGYWLHSISTLTDSRYIADPDTSAVFENANGVYTVKLYVKMDEAIEAFSYGTPVYHLLSINDLDLPAGGTEQINVEVWESAVKKGGKTVAQSSATEVRRPFD